MYIVLETSERSDELNTEKVLDILYTTDANVVEKWITNYLEMQCTSILYTPIGKNERDRTVSIAFNQQQSRFTLSKRFRQILRGYMYNSSQYTVDEIVKVRYLSFDGVNPSVDVNSIELQKDIKTEINHRVLKQLDKDSLYQVVRNVENIITQREHWTREEIIDVVSNVVHDFKRKLYNTIAKRLRTYNGCKTEANTIKPKIE